MIERRQLTHDDVRQLVLGSVELLREAQIQLNLMICPNILLTREVLMEGEFYADSLVNTKDLLYSMDFGYFTPPHTIMLDRNLPFSDRPMDIPELASTLSLYSAVHEVIHVDDYVGGNILHKSTREHMMENHRDKLNDAMDFISSNDGNDCIKTIAELANLSAGHYVDMVTHYRSYVALNYAEAPRLELIWDRLRNEYFPPDLLTMIEVDKGRDYVFKLFNENIGNYCLIDAFGEMESIGKRTARQYTV